ncbi:MAG: prolipoprotein diacylglyceryl transferase [Clostridia bacterium]|nr:prolipoprotein diacylglyceryl transferase [Clostridia bacterium]
MINLLNCGVSLNNMLLKDSIFIFGYEIKFYGIIIATAMLIAIFMARRLAVKREINPDEIFTLALFVIPAAILGARIYYCVFSEHSYTFTEFWNLRQGGIAIYGGVIGGIVGIILYCLVKRNLKLIPVLFDIAVPVLIFAQALGRWGNFFNQEAYGTIITNPKWQWFPFGVYIDDVQEWHLATFFYESMLNLVGTVVLLIIFYKSKKTGTTTAGYLIYYGAVRFFVEGLRTDSLYIGNSSIRVSQALSLIMVVIGIGILVYNSIKRKKSVKNN